MQNVRSGEFSGTGQVYHVLVQSQFAYIQLFFILGSPPPYREEMHHSDLEIVQSIFDLYFVNQDWLSLTPSDVLQQKPAILSVLFLR